MMSRTPGTRIVLSTFLAAMAMNGCADLTKPTSRTRSKGAPGGKADEAEPARTAQAARTARPSPRPSPTPANAPTPPDQQNTIAASHILVAYKGAKRARPDITRSKEEARQLAAKLAARAKKGEDFAQLAQQESDGPSGPRGGQLGRFTKDRMVPAFSNAAFALEPGGISNVVETDFGFHVIKRTE